MLTQRCLYVRSVRVCFQAQDEVLYQLAEEVKNFAVVYLVDITETPDFNQMYELYDPCTVMFFFRNKSVKHACFRLSAVRAAPQTRERSVPVYSISVLTSIAGYVCQRLRTCDACFVVRFSAPL
jgi:hypothetical protein